MRQVKKSQSRCALRTVASIALTVIVAGVAVVPVVNASGTDNLTAHVNSK